MNAAETTPGTVESLGVANALAHTMYERASKKLVAAGEESGWPVKPGVFEAWEKAMADVNSTLMRVVLRAPLGAQVYTPAGKMLVAYRDTETSADEATMVVVTADGVPVICQTWHEGESDESVYYERYTDAGRVAHGYVDRRTRKLTQTG